MKLNFILVFCLFCLLVTNKTKAQDSLYIRKIYDEALVDGKCYENLRYLCKNIGPRLSGSANAEKAVEWSKKLMESYGFDRVFLQEVMVPHWVRGEKEVGEIIVGGQRIRVPTCALGMSIGTPAQGLTAEVVEVHGLKDLDSLGEKGLKGKIVFFNGHFDPRFIETGIGYGTAGDQRFSGPAAVAKYGAAGTIVRSITEVIDDYPHTGATNSKEKPIPSAAISTKAADKLSEIIKTSKQPVKFYLKQNCKLLPDVLSYNVVAEMTGTLNPNKFIIVGGHLDSWDLAEGANDDGTGVMQSLEVLRVLKTMGYKPNNSLRAVFFMNEENGDKGGEKYAELAKTNKEDHIAAIETDEGGFTPRGFGFSGLPAGAYQKISTVWKALLEPYEADRLKIGGGGSDIGPLKNTVPGVVLVGYIPDSQRYFDIHHSAKDVFENVNKRELELGSAAMAALVYLIDQHGFQ